MSEFNLTKRNLHNLTYLLYINFDFTYYVLFLGFPVGPKGKIDRTPHSEIRKSERCARDGGYSS